MEAYHLESGKSLIGSSLAVNVVELGKRIKRKRQFSKLSLRAVAEQTQVSPSTLSRIENGSGLPDAPTLAKLSLWLGIPISSIIGSTASAVSDVAYTSHSTPDFIEAHLRADRNLTPEKAQALAELFRTVYNQVALSDI